MVVSIKPEGNIQCKWNLGKYKTKKYNPNINVTVEEFLICMFNDGIRTSRNA